MTLEHTSVHRAVAAGRAAPRGTVAVAPQVQPGQAVDISQLFEPPVTRMPAARPPRAAAAVTPPDTAPPQEGGFLAELERDATSRQTLNLPDPEVVNRNIRLANAACRAATDYWTRMAEHLNVLKRVAPGRYAFDGRTVLEGVCAQAFRVTPKLRVAHNGDELFESVTLGWRVGSGERMRLVKDFPAEIERLRARLSFAGVSAFESPVRHPQTGRLLGTQFEFTADVIASVRLTPLHENGKVRLSFHNIDALERIEAEMPAFAIRSGELDDLARWICGKPNALLKHAQAIVRHEP